MNIQFEFWQVVTLLLAFFGFLAGAGKLLLGQIERRLDLRFSAIERAAEDWQRLEKEFLTFQAQLPLHYVRREDWVRGQTVIEAKLDALAVRFDNMKLREGKS